MLDRVRPEATLVLLSARQRSPLEVARPVAAFTEGAARDAVARYADGLGNVTWASDAGEAAQWCGSFDRIVTPYAPMGPARDALDALPRPVMRILRPYDAMCWPHATAGFFKFRERIPVFVVEIKGLRAA